MHTYIIRNHLPYRSRAWNKTYDQRVIDIPCHVLTLPLVEYVRALFFVSQFLSGVHDILHYNQVLYAALDGIVHPAKNKEDLWRSVKLYGPNVNTLITSTFGKWVAITCSITVVYLLVSISYKDILRKPFSSTLSHWDTDRSGTGVGTDDHMQVSLGSYPCMIAMIPSLHHLMWWDHYIVKDICVDICIQDIKVAFLLNITERSRSGSYLLNLAYQHFKWIVIEEQWQSRLTICLHMPQSPVKMENDRELCHKAN